MRRKHAARVLFASCIALTGAGVSAAVAIGDGDDPAPVAATTLARGLAAPATVERAAAGPEFAEFGVRPAEAVEIPAPPAAATDQPWWVIPADRGSCFSPGNGALVCGTAQQLDAGRVYFVELPLLPAEAGPGADPTALLRIAGLVPDGITSVVASSDDGRELGRAAVERNVYEIPLDRAAIARSPSSALKSLELRRADGTTRARLHIGD